MIDDLIPAIQSEIEKGLIHETARLDAARENINYLRGQIEPYIAEMLSKFSKEYEEVQYPRVSMILQRVINVLSENLYSKGPAREIQDNAELTKWLQDQYNREGIDGICHESDRLSLTADVCLIQAVGSGDTAKPVRFQVWPADQFVVWPDENDPTKLAIVATLDYYDETRRLRLWTPDTVYDYRTEKLMPGQTANGRIYRKYGEDENNYGIVPFASFHATSPTTDFWTPGPGTSLKIANEYVNYVLTEIGQALKYARMPMIKAFGAKNSPSKVRYPGMVWHVQPTAIGEDGNGVPPDIDYLQQDLGYVEASWSDTQSYIDHVLECLGIPTNTFRMTQGTAASGVSIIAEQIPMIAWAESRQRDFAGYEKALARITIQVGKAELERLGSTPPTDLDAAWVDYLTLRWPSMVPDIPMTASDQATVDAEDLKLGITSRVKIVMRRFSMNREAALAYLKEVAKDTEEESKLDLPQPLSLSPSTTNDGKENDEQPNTATATAGNEDSGADNQQG